MTIHPTAVIEPQAEIGPDVTVGPFAYIQNGARLGAGCVVAPHATIYGCVTLGAGCRVHAGAVLGDWPQDVAFKDEPSFVRIGDQCILREGVTIHRGTKAGTETVLGNQCFLMANSHVGHNTRLGHRVILANGVLLAGYVEVGDGAFISGNAVVHQFNRIGRLAMVSGLSGLGKDLPPFCTTRGVRTNCVAGLNVIGMRRAGMTPAQRLEAKRAFKLLFTTGLNVRQALERLRADFPAGGPAHELADFVTASKRGICAWAGVATGEEEAE